MVDSAAPDVSAKRRAVVRLPQMPDLFGFADRLSLIRFDCRTGDHIAATEPLDALCPGCAAKYCAVMGDLRDAVVEGLARVTSA